MAHFQLMHARLGIPFKDIYNAFMLVISSSQGKFYTKNQIIVFVFVLASVLLCLFPATVVIQNFFDEFILEFIWLVICIYALRKIPDLLGIVVLQHD